MTNIPGVFAIGYVTCKEIRQAVTAAAEGSIAASEADRFFAQAGKGKVRLGLI